MDVLRNLQGIYRSGGLDAIGKSQIAGAENEANRNATARSNAIGEQARAQGMGNSAATLALKQQAGQDANQQVSNQAMGAAAQAEGNRMQALSGAQTASSAIDRFNAGLQNQSFQNRMQQLGEQGSLYGGAYGAQQTGDQRSRALWAGVGQGIGGVADYFKPKIPIPGAS